MAFRPTENSQMSSDTKGSAKPNAKWRCSTCGQAFSAEELRAERRAAAKAVGQP